MKKTFVSMLILMGSYLMPSLGWSYEFNFLIDSPVAYYNDQDWKLYKAAAKEALENRKNGSKVVWQNPANGHGGYFIPLNTEKKKGLTCRQLKIFSYGNHRTDGSTFEVCKFPSGWKIAGDDES